MLRIGKLYVAFIQNQYHIPELSQLGCTTPPRNGHESAGCVR
jgi:hypothetical protein